jgi:redox-sensing transcriptional repressor
VSVPGPHRIPEATVTRLPVYLRSLLQVADSKIATISSERLAELAGVNAAKVRKDLSFLGSYGTRGVGYDVEYLLYQISRELGLTQDWPVVIVGVGNLGQALANYGGFDARGFRIAGLVDADIKKVGRSVANLIVRHIDELPTMVAAERIAIGIIATPASAAQDVADRLVAAGVCSILNFAPARLDVPDHVSFRKVDLSTELQILSFYQQRQASKVMPPEAALAQAGQEDNGVMLPVDQSSRTGEEVGPSDMLSPVRAAPQHDAGVASPGW